jgi:hypothetical protein
MSGDNTLEHLVVSDVRLAALVRVLSSATRRDGIPTEYRNGNDLVRRMKDVFTFPMDQAPGWLWRPVFEGLLEGGDALNFVAVPPNGAPPMPILTWLCQWKSLKELFCWKGDWDMVSMVLAGGADPNKAIANGSTPIFFAVKYGCSKTVKLLVKYGADLKAKDMKGRSCLWNALERPDPKMIRYLLGTLPADETFPYQRHGHKKDTSHQTALDYIFASQLSLSFDPETNPEYPFSWQILGPPTEEDVALSMIEFGRRGVTITPNEVTSALLSFVLRGDDPNRRRNRYPKYQDAKQQLERTAKLVMGLWLPQSLHEEIRNWNCEEHKADESDTCHICWENMPDAARPRTKLYCGHEFCTGCILGRGSGKTLDVTCPICFSILCLDLTINPNRRWECLSEVYGEDFNGRHGPRALSSSQLRMECQAQEISTLFRSDEKLRSLMMGIIGRENEPSDKGVFYKFDLNTNVPITNGFNIHLLPPKGGPVFIPINVKGVQILVLISTTSAFTLLAPEFVELFGLRRSKLNADEFRNLLGRSTAEGEQTLIEEFPFKLGEIAICLNNCLATPLPAGIAVQLGLDFLRSGAWCLIDVTLDGNVHALEQNSSSVSIDGFGHVIQTSSNRKEELRYHGHQGATVRLPLWHLHPFKDGCMTNWKSVRLEDSYQECNWCCRLFLEGHMLSCEECLEEGIETHYCSLLCQTASYDIHKVRHE